MATMRYKALCSHSGARFVARPRHFFGGAHRGLAVCVLQREAMVGIGVTAQTAGNPKKQDGQRLSAQSTTHMAS